MTRNESLYSAFGAQSVGGSESEKCPSWMDVRSCLDNAPPSHAVNTAATKLPNSDLFFTALRTPESRRSHLPTRHLHSTHLEATELAVG